MNRKERAWFEENEAIIREIAAQGAVLLENRNNTLPLQPGDKYVALYGGGATHTVYGGGGSSVTTPRHVVSIYDAFKEAGYTIVSEKSLEAYERCYEETDKKILDIARKINTPAALCLDPYRPGDINIPDEDFAADASRADTAIYVLSRMIEEGWDRKVKGKPVKLVDDAFKELAMKHFCTEAPNALLSFENLDNSMKFAELAAEYINDSYELTEIEISNIRRMVKRFKKSIVLLNTGCVVDVRLLSEMKDLGALLLISYGGMEAGNAVLDVLEGRVNPSGKLTDTWAARYEDNPASKYYALNGDGDSSSEKYTEGIYVGYRYFDSFGIKPLYPFGYGMSYTDFSIKVCSVKADEMKVTVCVEVTNTGKSHSGKEVVQIYCSAPDGELEKPYQELIAFAKTDELKPGEKQMISISFPLAQMASYSQAKAAFVLEAGDYIIRCGNSSRNTHVAAVLRLNGTAVTEQLMNRFNNAVLTEISKAGAVPFGYEEERAEIASAPLIMLDANKIAKLDTANNGFPYDNDDAVTYIVGNEKDGPLNPADSVYLKDTVNAKRKHRQKICYVNSSPGSKLIDVINGKVTLEEFIAQIPLEKLANLINREVMDPEIFSRYGIPTPRQLDGPVGIRVMKYYKEDGSTEYIYNNNPVMLLNKKEFAQNPGGKYLYCSGWPCSLLMAQSWDTDLCEKFGRHILIEMKERNVDVLLAPGLNIHRDPLCGRAFEYLSEDPLISGIMAASIIRGVQAEPGYGACIKHVAVNSQETNRYRADSVLSERALREIYLKGFCMAIRSARPMVIMTSYNLINGVHASESFDLCTNIIRGEWGFNGLIRTDGLAGENHDISMYAGNEWISYINAFRSIIRHTDHTKYDPVLDAGSEPLTENDETIYLGDVQRSAMNIIKYVMFTKTVETKLGVHCTPHAEGYELVDYIKTEKTAKD